MKKLKTFKLLSFTVILIVSVVAIVFSSIHTKLFDSNDNLYVLISDVSNGHDGLTYYTDSDGVNVYYDDTNNIYCFQNDELITLQANETTISLNGTDVSILSYEDSTGSVIKTDTSATNYGILCTLDNGAYIVEDYNSNQIHFVNDGDVCGLLSEYAFGFSYEEYYNLSDKYNTIYWFENPIVNQSKNKIAYWSNKDVKDNQPCFGNGIWVVDLIEGREFKLDIKVVDGKYIPVNPISWVNDTTIMFEITDGETSDYYRYDVSNNVTDLIASLPSAYVHVDGNIMIYSENNEVTVWNIEKLENFVLNVENTVSIEKIFVNDSLVAFTNRQDSSTIIIDLKTCEYTAYSSEFNNGILRVCGWNSEGELVLNLFDSTTSELSGIYKLNEGVVQ